MQSDVAVTRWANWRRSKTWSHSRLSGEQYEDSPSYVHSNRVPRAGLRAVRCSIVASYDDRMRYIIAVVSVYVQLKDGLD
jgi:hypothetical protein